MCFLYFGQRSGSLGSVAEGVGTSTVVVEDVSELAGHLLVLVCWLCGAWSELRQDM